MTTKYRPCVLYLLIATTGCGGKSNSTTESGDPPADRSTKPVARDPASEIADDENTTCFGIPNDFSGKLSDDQEARVPEPLRGAFYVEAVQDITIAELAKEMEDKRTLARDSQNGIEYIALQDFRCVQFDAVVSGQMIVIERYRIRGD